MADKPKITTICKNCIFAEWTEHNGHNTQTGCKFNRLDKFNKLDVLSMEELEDKTYYKIDRFCNACHKGQYIDGAEEIVRQRIQPRVDCVVLADEGPLDISDIFLSLREQTIQPKTVQFITQNKNYAKDIFDYTKDFKTEFKTSVHIALSTVINCYSQIVKKSKNQYTTSFLCDFIPTDFIQRIDHYLNEELEQFLIIKPENGIHGTVIHNNINRLFSHESIIERVQNIQKTNPNLVLQWK